jgi:hypothetical protein
MSSVKALLTFCSEQPWWPLVEPLFAQDLVVDIHVAHLPEDAMRPDWPTRGEFGILVSPPRPGVVIVRICDDCKNGEPWHVRLAPRGGAPIEQIVQQTIAQQQVFSRASSIVNAMPVDDAPATLKPEWN